LNVDGLVESGTESRETSALGIVLVPLAVAVKHAFDKDNSRGVGVHGIWVISNQFITPINLLIRLV
jgi:hypothetical protein